MRRRLSPEARRAEIVEVAGAAIAADGYRTLSLRELARRCGMSTPGLTHYFPDLPSLLEAVLAQREDVGLAEIAARQHPDASLLDVLESARVYASARPDEVRGFDALEAEALDPGHPAHAYFAARNERTLALLRSRIDREYEHPEQVAEALGLLLDGLRVRRVRSAGRADDDAGWRAILRLVAGLPRLPDAPRSDRTAQPESSG